MTWNGYKKKFKLKFIFSSLFFHCLIDTVLEDPTVAAGDAALVIINSLTVVVTTTNALPRLEAVVTVLVMMLNATNALALPMAEAV